MQTNVFLHPSLTGIVSSFPEAVDRGVETVTEPFVSGIRGAQNIIVCRANSRSIFEAEDCPCASEQPKEGGGPLPTCELHGRSPNTGLLTRKIRAGDVVGAICLHRR